MIIRHFWKTIVGALIVAWAANSHAQVYTKYGPANGVQKGSTATYQNTAAVAADIYGLWSGTCNSTTFLRGDGACAAAAGSVTSVAMTMPTGFAVSGSPITSSGTLAVTTALSGVLKGNGSGFTTSVAADIYGLWSGTCNATTFLRGDGSCATPAAGGSPGGSTTQVQYNNAGAFGGSANFTFDGTSVVTLGNSTSGTIVGNAAATVTSVGASVNVQGGPGGTTSGNGGGSFLKGGVPTEGNGGDVSIAGGNAATVSATTRYGGSVFITSGNAAVSGSGGGIDLHAGAGAVTGSGGGVTLTSGSGGTTSGNSGPIALITNAPTSGTAGNISMSQGGITAFVLSSSNLTIGASTRPVIILGGAVVGSPTGGNQGAGTLNMTGCFVNGVACTTGGVAQTTGTFTISATTGSTPSATATWTKVGNLVTANWPFSMTGTSAATSFSLTGIPAAIQPTGHTDATTPILAEDNGVAVMATGIVCDSGGAICPAGNINLLKPFGAAWTASGTKGVDTQSVSWILN